MHAVFLVLAAAAILCTNVSSLSPAEASQPPVQLLIHTYGPFALNPGLQQMPPAMQIVFPDELWVVGYHTETVDKVGSLLSRELQCHTYLGTSMPAHHSHDTVAGLFSDGYTPGLELPSGFGIRVRSGEKLFWTPMFNNRSKRDVEVSMRLELKVVRSSEWSGSLKPLEMTFRSVHEPDLYMVGPGRSVESRDFTLPPGHTIHAIGTHIHPYGQSIELVNTRRDETVWKAVGTRGADGRLVSMPVYSDARGYAVKTGDSFRLIATYDNPTQHPVDAMAGIFILYSEDGTTNDAEQYQTEIHARPSGTPRKSHDQ
jgi:hypothetical protein